MIARLVDGAAIVLLSAPFVSGLSGGAAFTLACFGNVGAATFLAAISIAFGWYAPNELKDI